MKTSKPTVDARAFTLIELLVVLAIVAILATMVFPGGSRVKSKAMVASCLNHHKQLGAGWVMSAADNPDRAVSMSDTSTNDWIVRPDCLKQADLPATSSSQDANIKYDVTGFKLAALSLYVPDPSVIHCPADFRWKLAQSNYAYRSISGTKGLDREALSVTSQIKHPSDRFLWIEENDARLVIANGKKLGENLGAWGFEKDPDPATGWAGLHWYRTPAAFHTASGSFSFADGHAENHRWQDSETLMIASPTLSWEPASSGKLSQATNLIFSETSRDLRWVAEKYFSPCGRKQFKFSNAPQLKTENLKLKTLRLRYG